VPSADAFESAEGSAVEALRKTREPLLSLHSHEILRVHNNYILVIIITIVILNHKTMNK
jgi:hypothetical protein